MQDMEFTVEEGTLYMLQTRVGKRTPSATFRMAVDMANEGLIRKEEAILRVKPEDIERLFYPVIDAKVPRADLAKRKFAAESTRCRGQLRAARFSLPPKQRSGLHAVKK